MIYLVFGTSGAGKSSLITLLKKIDPKITIHQKDTTRLPRKTESKEGSLDLKFVNKLKKEDYEIIYYKYGNYYGIRKDILKQSYKTNAIHFIIIRDINAIRLFKYMHPKAKSIYIHTDPLKIPIVLQAKEGIEFNERVKRIEEEFNDFVKNNSLFDFIIVNFWNMSSAKKQLKNILKLNE
jgi:guanylate kinase